MCDIDRIEEVFKKQYSITKSGISSPVICRYGGLFSLSDENSCIPKCVRYSECIDRVIVKCCTSTNTYIIHHGNYIHSIGKSGWKGCDYILCNTQQIVFCELTCSMESYIFGSSTKESKKDYARKQLADSIERLYRVPDIKKIIDKKPQKVALFAFRMPEVSNPAIVNDAIKGMEAFNKPNEAISNFIGEELTSGFIYRQVQYPQSFNL